MMAEFVFIAPVLMLFFLGITEFYMMVATRISLLEASRAAVRVAASEGYAYKSQAATDADKTAHAALGGGRLSRFSHVHVVWSQDLPADQTSGQADWVEVTVDVRARTVIPDVLAWAGFSLGGRNLAATTIMKQE
jgi:Flp pilus assembly protein TadG